MPGEDVIYFDCRILPNYDVENVILDIQSLTKQYEEKTGAKIKVEVIQKQVSPQLLEGNTAVVDLLKNTLKQAKNLDARVGGIGGGTCAAFFRKHGIQAAVWSTIDELAHQPNEYAKIQNLVEDAKIYALLAIN